MIGGYFSAAELALVSLRDSQVNRLAGQSRRGAPDGAIAPGLQPVSRGGTDWVTLAGFFSAAYGAAPRWPSRWDRRWPGWVYSKDWPPRWRWLWSRSRFPTCR
jgi:hypothetical protein